VLFTLVLVPPALADDALPTPDSPLVKLLSKAPKERRGQIAALVAKRGTPADLRYLLDQTLAPDAFTPDVRLKALEGLADAALTRATKPDAHLEQIGALITPEGGKGDPALRLAAIRLAGLWKVEELVNMLNVIASSPATDAITRAAALDAMASLSSPAARQSIEKLTAEGQPNTTRAQATAALARLDPKLAATKAATLIRAAEKGQDFVPLMAAFLNRKEGADLLASALATEKLPADNAKLALRAIYALGRADAALIAALSKAAGIDAENRPLSKEELEKLVAEVVAKGDAHRGEMVFRRADLNCMKCHAIAGAAGGVGPELSSVGLSSPIDYVINSILVPDQAIKEQYHTLVVATTDGQVFQGIVTDKDDSKVVLREATGDLRTVPSSEIDESKPGGSLMPKGLANLLTHDEFLDLVRFVSELGKPGPFALHAVPTIQRWRLLKPVPEDLAKAVPDAGAFVSQVRDSDPSRWVAAYALSTGELPLGEFAEIAGSPIVYAQGEIDVSSPGPIAFSLGGYEGVSAWIDDAAVPTNAPIMKELAAGKHTLTLRIETRPTRRGTMKVEVTKPPGSSAEFTVVGGR
jgi:putative heme-binding domain-containing protein